jgi:hypothetical protein
MAGGRILSIDQELKRSQSELRTLFWGAEYSAEGSVPMDLDMLPNERYLFEMAQPDVMNAKKLELTKDVFGSWKTTSKGSHTRFKINFVRADYEFNELVIKLNGLRGAELTSIQFTLFPGGFHGAYRKRIPAVLERNDDILNLVILLVDVLVADLRNVRLMGHLRVSDSSES